MRLPLPLFGLAALALLPGVASPAHSTSAVPLYVATIPFDEGSAVLSEDGRRTLAGFAERTRKGPCAGMGSILRASEKDRSESLTVARMAAVREGLAAMGFDPVCVRDDNPGAEPWAETPQAAAGIQVMERSDSRTPDQRADFEAARDAGVAVPAAERLGAAVAAAVPGCRPVAEGRPGRLRLDCSARGLAGTAVLEASHFRPEGGFTVTFSWKGRADASEAENRTVRAITEAALRAQGVTGSLDHYTRIVMSPPEEPGISGSILGGALVYVQVSKTGETAQRVIGITR